MVHGTIGWEEQLLGSAIMCQMMPVMGVPPLARDIAQFSWGVGFTLARNSLLPRSPQISECPHRLRDLHFSMIT